MADDQVRIMCAAGDDILVASAFDARSYGNDDEPPMTFISFYQSLFYAKQVSFVQRLWERVKLATSILLGREYQLEELMIESAEDHSTLAKFFFQQELACRRWNDSHGK